MSADWRLPASWVWTECGEIAEVAGGGTPSTSVAAYFGGDIPWVTPADMSTHSGKLIGGGARTLTEAGFGASGAKWLPAGSVLFSSRAPIGYCAIASRAMTTNQGFKSFVPLVGVNPGFLLYWLRSAKSIAEERASGTTFLELSGAKAATLPIPLAPVAEQVRIVEALEPLLDLHDAGVAELERAQLRAKQYRQSLLKAAVEGDLTAEWRASNPPQETGAELLARILRERRARWESRQLERFAKQGKSPPKDWRSAYAQPTPPDDSQLHVLPREWAYATLGQCFDVAVGATPSRKAPEYWNGEVPWVSSGEVRFNRIAATRESITQLGLENSSTQLNPIGSVLLGMIGEGRTRGQVAILDIEAANNQNCAAIWVSRTEIPTEFIYYWLWSRYDETRRGSSGNNQPALNKALVEAMPTPVPPVLEAREIVERVAGQLAAIERQEHEVERLLKMAAAQRQNILRAAFSGQLVPQDPNDEPASVLLERIRTERAATSAASPRPLPRRRARQSAAT